MCVDQQGVRVAGHDQRERLELDGFVDCLLQCFHLFAVAVQVDRVLERVQVGFHPRVGADVVFDADVAHVEHFGTDARVVSELDLVFVSLECAELRHPKYLVFSDQHFLNTKIHRESNNCNLSSHPVFGNK